MFEFCVQHPSGIEKAAYAMQDTKIPHNPRRWNMTYNILALLPSLLPAAIAWAKSMTDPVIRNGSALTEQGLSVASAVGVAMPERIHIAMVDSLPMPQDETLRNVVCSTGLFGPDTVGLTLGYAILIAEGHATRRLLTHEFRHVHQYEKAGSIEKFLLAYLAEIATFGYFDAPLEIDARDHELH
ncbi:conserved hypothetical protein [Cupriavidus taiwanensis]|nr:conserved hypothetical protein [Cupriavidus taiwanensis]SOZ40545.1 conserved hypothetical protein [Cupriavidus neocaledonicus]SOZ02337.1 conserved hypothetical protein [Cupriavidus taiwanensis]SOZ20231.1 conserved hypothetical protein [Cupriavidus taiwanensis]SOZ21479.1 conserved hypothetical protein [Cupriavidus taiwanensis]